VSNQLTKANAGYKKLKDPTSLSSALRKGGPIAWFSTVLMGLGNFTAGQIIKGLLFLFIEAAYIIYMFFIPTSADNLTGGGLFWLKKMTNLGDIPFRKDFDEWGIQIQLNGDESVKILLFGVATICITVLFIIFWRASVRSGYQAMTVKRSGKKPLTFLQDIKELFDSKIHKLLMTLPFIGIIVFTIVPLIYMICMAFTNYDKQHLTLFDWVGFDNFAQLFNSSAGFGDQFWSVLGWTLIWAVFATFLNFFFGTFVAMIINRPTTRLKGLWRTLFSLTIAIPQFVSLLLIANMFKDQGIINRSLIEMGWITEPLPFFKDPTWARILVIVVNLWVGIPYTIMQVTGILKNIPADLYEAAKIDGANVAQQFIHITLPYMIFVMTPYIITSFTGNINNFNVIFLLSGGGPPSTNPAHTAGKTDLLVTWLYKLTFDRQNYKLAAVIGIFTFVVLAIVSLITYRSSGSYKDEEGFK